MTATSEITTVAWASRAQPITTSARSLRSEIANQLLRLHARTPSAAPAAPPAEAVDHERHGLFLVHAALAAVEQLIVVDLGCRRLMLHAGGVVLHLDIGNRVRPAFVADQKAVALGVVAAFLGLGVHRHEPAIGVLRTPRADPLGHDPRFRALAQMHHLRAGIGLLGVVGDGDGVELAL
jgi:hypothetical protein